MTIEKYEKDGKVGVLYTPSSRAKWRNVTGWSTWMECGANDMEWLLMDKTLVELTPCQRRFEE